MFPFDYYEQLSMISFKNEEKSLNELNIFSVPILSLISKKLLLMS
ncbi:hypothetical protein AC73_1070 [Escherichia coli 2-427-07_S4_C1]|nr:hypothetical protein ECDEC15A_4218 [Escherichia coli DEC15A]KDY48463.1 hypothetical protein AC73_1070 [Escherichia coli 2-427-07_S4_C1]KEK83416.1 hypothetical protein AB48_1780 [Escherichia coli 3-475-03_S1_C2]